MRSGIYLVLPLVGPEQERVLDMQRRLDPRLSREWPPHATLAGSSGMGPLDGDLTTEELRAAIAPIAADTAPLELPFGAPTRFMQSNVVVLPLDPHGALRTLHERIKSRGLRYAPPRFAFTPHVTLSFYPELSADRARDALSYRPQSPARFEEIGVYRSFQNRTSKLLLTCKLQHPHD